MTYHDNDKVQPTPGVGEVLDKAKGEPLDEHLKEKNDCKEFVNVTEVFHKGGIFLKVDIFKSVQKSARVVRNASIIGESNSPRPYY